MPTGARRADWIDDTMSDNFQTDNPELDALFDRYRNEPASRVFAPLSDACRKAGMLEEAIEICEKGVSAHPDYASGFVVRGKCYYDIGSPDQAEASFERVLELDANNFVALKYIGMILAERGESEAARRRFERVLALDPDDREIARKLEDLAVETDTAPEGVEPEVSESNEDPREVGDAGAAHPAVRIEPGEATEESFVGKEISLGDGDPTPDVLATMTLADIYASQGYRRKAIKIYRDVLDRQPGNAVALEKLRELGADEGRSPHASNGSPSRADGGSERVAEQDTHSDPVGAAGDEANGGVEPEAGDGALATSRTDGGSGGKQPDLRDETSVSQFRRWLDHLNR